MARNRSVDFLPEIFKTDPNKEFLSATLDQLVQEPKLKQIQGYVGNKFKAGATTKDTYLLEPTIERANYQLETGVVFTDENNDAESAITYPEIIDALKTKGANVTKHDRLFSNEAYSWNPLIDLDKFINHSQYYWIPNGPDTVDVSATEVNITDDFNVVPNDGYYTLSGISGQNPTITLARGGEYNFNSTQTGTFYIQTEPGTSGNKSVTPNVSTREVYGVTNNGGDVINFAVPEADQQKFYHDLTKITDVDLATTARFDSINGAVLANLKTIDGISDLNGKTIIFLDKTAGNSADLGWQYLDLFESDDTFESDPLDRPIYIDSQADRYSVYKIQYLTSGDSTVIKLNKIKGVNQYEKFNITYGTVYSGLTFYKNSAGYFDQVPVLSASTDVLYYQDATDENRFGVIKLVDDVANKTLNIEEDIIGKSTYTSPNGVQFTNGLKVIFRGNTLPESYEEQSYWVEGVGESIVLIPVVDLITPEGYTSSLTQPYDSLGYDSSSFDSALNSPLDLDYITINRSSNDLNAWSRGNRWVHKQVIEKTAEYNNTTPVFDNNNRANRPIIEFKANLKLFNYGTESKGSINIIDLTQTDALSNVNGTSSYTTDGYALVDGSKIIFANDADPNVRNKIYVVEMVDLEGDINKEIRLIETDESTSVTDQLVVCTNGDTQGGKVYHYNGTEWIESQQKTKLNQPPLFDVYDKNGYSFSESSVYSRTTFEGCKVFAYGEGDGLDDSVLGFPLKYLSIDNIGDIVFDNCLYMDTFTYDLTSIVKNVSDGFVRKYSDRTTYTKEIGWTKHIDEYVDNQVFNFEYDGKDLILDVILKTGLNTPNVKVYIDGKYCLTEDYNVTQSLANNTTTISFNKKISNGADIYVTAISDQKSDVAYYTVATNLENNPFNENLKEYTLGTIRNHYIELAQNLKTLEGDLNGSNNSRDLPNIEKYSRNIIQNSSPVIPMAKFLHSEKFNFFESLDFASNAYEKFKLKIIDYVNSNDTYDIKPSVILENALKEINKGKSSLNAFYKSDMLPGSTTPTESKFTFSAISTNTFNTQNIYDFSRANNKAILVYLNNDILTIGEEYTVSSDSANITILKDIVIGDEIVIKEYDTTVGSYVPNTPSKLGLHPVYIPKKYSDTSYSTPTNVIQGHDGSIIIAYNDKRDDVILEFEKRIYNNIKLQQDNLIPIIEADVIPGKFRETEYSDEEVTSILSTSFLKWVGTNRLEYKKQDYSSTNEFSWNYSTAGSLLDGTALKGNWRGVYKNYYDTDTPHTTPWEMVGFSKKPTWWEEEYGPAPYTRGNLVLWEDLEAGRIKDPSNTRIVEKYKRPGLTNIIPVSSSGKLLSPFEALVNNYNEVDFRKSWVFGDQGPTETAWRRSSSYRFALQRLYALTKPAKYFALNIDRDLYKYDSDLDQYLYDGRYRLDVRDIETQTVAQPKNSYINWIADYHNNNGCSCTEISQELASTDVRLCYRMASFTDKNFLKIYTDKSSPDSSNTGLQIPDQNYKLLLHKNQALNELHFSSVIVQRTSDGYSMYGHSSTRPYFEIYRSVTDANGFKIGDYVVPTKFTKNVTTVPYGYVFRSKGAVVDFLASYGAFLEDKGMIFDIQENGTLLNWGQMAEEFLAWSGQDWGEGAIINLNPGAISLEFNKELLIVDDITKNSIDALDQNGIPLLKEDYAITRLDNSFKIQTVNNKSINLLKINSISYEHLLILDNTSIFNDLIYQPVTGLRQQRLRIVGFTTFDWNGQLDAQGFILNQDNVEDWKQDTYYTTGSIVKNKNAYWTSVKRLEPKETFDFSDWKKINYDSIKKGLLPNIANKAGQITEYYNKKTTNLESDVDLFAMGLLGYRPRDYLSTLDDVSRVNFYTRFIGEKGTTLSANVFKNVELDKQITDYDIFENWAIKEATYGNSDNRTYIELELTKPKLESNPSLVEVVEDQSKINVVAGTTVDTTSYTADSTEVTADPDRVVEIIRNPVNKKHQVINVSDIYNQSYTHTNANIFPIRTTQLTDINLPTAGFVNTNDVDIAVFEKTDLNDTVGVVFLNKIEEGTVIWVAKDNVYNWNVYRAEQVGNIKSITENDTGTLTIVFYADHELVANEWMVIQDISAEVNGAHKVTKVNSTTELEIAGSIETAYVQLTADADVVTCDSDLYTADHTTGNTYRLVSVRTDSYTDLTNTLFSGLPNNTLAWVDNNANDKPAVYKKVDGDWTQYRVQQDNVNTDLINKALIYDKTTNLTDVNLDYIDPLNGKLLGDAQENIDYISINDPAVYNYDAELTGIVWAEQYVGSIWWDVSNVRFLDYYASDENYASKNWGALFTGSTVDVRQWVKSSLPPSKYNGAGTVVDQTKYTVVSKVNSSNTITQNYYFWVTNVDSIQGDKTLSINNIKTYISTPISSGIPYVAFINRSTVALYNSNKYITDGILHLSYKKEDNNNEVFNEFKLVKENNKNSFISDNTYLKLQDSLIGGNKIGLAVPDSKLSPVQQIGIAFRPRQSMFKDRFGALASYLGYVNDVLKKEIIATNKDFTQLKVAEPMPGESSGEWDKKVADLDELGYQNLLTVAVGYKYLVEVDSDNQSGWSIYEVVAGPALRLVKVQSYDTTRSWSYVDWYKDTEAENAIFEAIVDDTSKITSANVEDGKYVKVTSNSQGKFEIYQYKDGAYVRVGLEDGTIKFNESLWSGKSTQDNITVDSQLFTADNFYNTADTGTRGNELRNVIKAINEDIFTGDLLIERNKSLIVLFDYILQEQQDVEWLTKTSFIDVEQKVRDLGQYATYKKDDQEFLQNYLNESKPYHTKIKNFTLKYDGNDQYNTDVIDFDCPVYFDTTFNKYISPVLDHENAILKSDQSNFDEDGVGLKETNYNIWELTPWNNWFNNRGLSVKSIEIVNAGQNYTVPPKIEFIGGNPSRIAKATSRINASGQIVEVTITDAGEGYQETPSVRVENDGELASLIPIMENKLVRTVKTTLKYDRLEYDYTVVNWVSNPTPRTTVDTTDITADSGLLTVDSADDVYEAGALVRHQNVVYTQNVTRAFKEKFLLDDYTKADITDLSAADRTMGYYTPTDNMKGLSLPLLIDGTVYPGVEVTDVDFTDTSTPLDAMLQSEFGEVYLGTNPQDINTVGGEFIDTYSSHSPEELIPGAMYDTLDLKVHTRPGFDYRSNGHGFEADYIRYNYDSSGSNVFSFYDVVQHPITLIVINGSTGRRLHVDEDYLIDWPNKTIEVIANAFDGDLIQINVYEIGGGNQLFRQGYVGTEFGVNLDIPVNAQEINEIVILVNGVRQTSGYSSTADGKLTVDNTLTTADNNRLTVDKVSTITNSVTTITFTTNYSASDWISVTVFGFEDVQHSWSYPINSHFDPYTGDTIKLTADDTTITVDSEGFNLSKTVPVDGRNALCAIVEKNGFRLRPPEGKRYEGDDVETDFRLPTKGLIDHTLISNSEIVVFLDNEKQIRPTDYTVISVVDGSTTYKEVRFNTAPESGSIVDVYTTNKAEYTIDSQGILRVKGALLGTDHIEVTTYGDTDQQDILTSVFVGPTTVTAPVIELFDSGAFDAVGFDFVGTSASDTNLFDVGRDISNDNRLWVTVNGEFLIADLDYYVVGSNLLLAGELISPTDVVAVTSFTSNIVPDAISYRWFKDMQGNVAMYKMDTYHVEKLKYDLEADDTIIYLENIDNLPIPNMELGNFGIVMIDAERVTYREIEPIHDADNLIAGKMYRIEYLGDPGNETDFVSMGASSNTVGVEFIAQGTDGGNGTAKLINAITGLRRGTAGTAAAPHSKGTLVEDFSRRHFIEGSEKQSVTFGSDTSTSSYVGDSIFYASGATTASNGIALQNQNTTIANFIKNTQI